MRFRWSEFAAVGCHLAMRPLSLAASDDALLRCAVGRFYYALFCSLRDEFLRQDSWGVGLDGPHTSGVHRQLIRALRRHATNGHLVEIGDHLDNLRRYRNTCDYETVIPRRSTGPQSVREVYDRALDAVVGVLGAAERAGLPIAMDAATRDLLPRTGDGNGTA